jgi:hypothetical protein
MADDAVVPVAAEQLVVAVGPVVDAAVVGLVDPDLPVDVRPVALGTFAVATPAVRARARSVVPMTMRRSGIATP